jgi:hypothetical protein
MNKKLNLPIIKIKAPSKRLKTDDYVDFVFTCLKSLRKKKYIVKKHTNSAVNVRFNLDQ